jgi:RNA polymerase sigma-70 factor (ECF subfamily)
MIDLAASPSQVAEKRERRVLLEALRQLNVETQVMLELYHFERLTGIELAGLLGIGERALRSRLHRAHAAPREAVERVARSAS